MKPRKRFGQHFLRDPALIKKMAELVAPAAGEEILEIGPGDGALTAELLQAEARLLAVEIDRDLAAVLEKRFGSGLRLIVGDVLKQDLSVLLQGGRRVVGNLPYGISTPLLLKLAACETPEMWLMLQKEVAERVCAAPGEAEYGRLTVSVRLFFDAAIVMRAPPEAFWPPPKVDSAVVRLSRREPPPHSPLIQKVLASAFQTRRKMIANGLAAFDVDWASAGIDSARRPQTLSPEEFARLSLYVQEKKGDI